MIIRVPYPTVTELQQLLKEIAEKERFKIDSSQGERVIEKSGRNLRSCLLLFQLAHSKGFFQGTSEDIDEPEWKMAIHVGF